MRRRPTIQLPLLILCVAVPLAIGLLGGLTTASSVKTWYVHLRKPFFTPPAWVFGPVWTILYIAMGIASYLVVRNGLSRPRVRPATTLYLVQLALNGLWSPVFFGLHSPLGGLAIIVMLLPAAAITAMLFRPISRGAYWLMVPYVLWVAFATALNIGFVWVNGR